jgi:lipoyl(octanoyl) transferase
MKVRRLGRADYVRTWHAMREFTAQRGPDTEDELWLVEHPPVFTLGQAGRLAHLLAETPIPVIATDRGGQITYHGPGQVIVYPLLDLRRLGIYVKELVFRIEQAVIQTLASVDVVGMRVLGAPGIYVQWSQGSAPPPFAGLAKVAAIGIKVARQGSYHGVALNVAMDLSPYSLIDPCGYAGLPAIDLAALGAYADSERVGAILIERLRAQFAPRSPAGTSLAPGRDSPAQ